MEFNRRQTQLLCDLRVLNFLGLLERQTLHSLRHVGAGSNRTAASESLELDVGDDAALIYSDLELHDISATANTVTKEPHAVHRIVTYAGAPTRPVPTSTSFLGRDPTYSAEQSYQIMSGTAQTET